MDELCQVPSAATAPHPVIRRYGSLHYVRTRDPRSFKAATSGKRTSGGAQKWLDMQVSNTRCMLLKVQCNASFARLLPYVPHVSRDSY